MDYTKEQLTEACYKWQDKAKKLEDTRSLLIVMIVIISIVAVLAGYFAIKTSLEYSKYKKEEGFPAYQESINSTADYRTALQDIRNITLPKAIDTRLDCTKMKLSTNVESCKNHNEIVGEVITNPEKYLP